MLCCAVLCCAVLCCAVLTSALINCVPVCPVCPPRPALPALPAALTQDLLVDTFNIQAKMYHTVGGRQSAVQCSTAAQCGASAVQYSIVPAAWQHCGTLAQDCSAVPPACRHCLHRGRGSPARCRSLTSSFRCSRCHVGMHPCAPAAGWGGQRQHVGRLYERQGQSRQLRAAQV